MPGTAISCWPEEARRPRIHRAPVRSPRSAHPRSSRAENWPVTPIAAHPRARGRTPPRSGTVPDAAARPTGTGWPTPGPTRTRPTPPGTSGAQAGTGPGDGTGGAVDVRAAAGRAQRRPEHPWDAGRLAAHQRERLRALLACAIGGSPFHAWRLAGIDPGRFELDDLADLPLDAEIRGVWEPHTVWTRAGTLRACSSLRMSPGSLVKTRSACAVSSATCASTISAEPDSASSSPM